MIIEKSVSGKVLTITPSAKGEVGGISFAVNNLLKFYEEKKFVETVNYPTKHFSILYFFRQVCNLVICFLTDKDIEIVHIHFASKGSFIRKFLIYLLCKFIFKKKIVLHLHGGGFLNYYHDGNRFRKFIILKFLHNSNKIIVLSEIIKEKIVQSLKISNEMISVVSNIAVLDGIQNNKRTRTSAKIELLFIGNIVKEKGVFDLIEMFHNSDIIKEHVCLVIAGIGKDYLKLKKLIDEYNLKDNVKVVGYVQGQSKFDYISNCDCFVLPSYFEALPVSILEAMSMGKAIISTNIGGIPDLVENNINGFLFSPGDIDALIKCVCELIDMPMLLDKFGGNSLDRYREGFSIEKILESLNRVYIQLLDC